MLKIFVNKNVVFLDKRQLDYKSFVSQFLTKYEEVKKIDFYNSTKKKKVYKTVKERRDLYVEDSNYIYFSRGILELIPYIENYDLKYLSEDHIIVPSIDRDRIRNSMSKFTLREDQVTAVLKCIINKRGVIQLPTAIGKSAIITVVIKELLLFNPEIKILVLAPTLSTVNNIHETFLEEGLNSTVFGHPSKEVNSCITTSLVQSLISSSKDNPELLKDIDAVFYDECLPANSLILLPDGSCKTISDIYDDDTIQEVMSYNIGTNEYEIKKIVHKYKTPHNKRFWRVYYDNPVTGKVEGITLTGNHKVYTRDRGYIQAQDLTSNDFIKIDFNFARTIKTLYPVTFVRVKYISASVGSKAPYKYNLEVEDNHNYFASNVLVSNCHHLKCDTWSQLNMLLHNVEYSLGFSALSIDKSEIYCKDIRDISYQSSLIVGASGPVIMHMDPSYYIEKGIIALPVVLRIDNHIELPEGFDETVWTKLVKEGIMSTPRTYDVARISGVFNKYGRKVLVLINERDHAFMIGNFLASLGITNYGISFGSGTGYLYKEVSGEEVIYDSIETLKVLDKLSSGEINIVIGTNHVDEGVDIKNLDCIILACGGKKDRRIIQRVGRALRKSKTGKYAYIVDFTDEGSRVLSRQSRERLSMYKNTIGIPKNNLFDRIQFNEIEKKFKELEGLV